MQEHNFDEILDYLCSGIMSKSERQSVRDELYDHLMCRYETNIAVGMDENEAEEKAVESLGNKAALKDNLQKVHWYYPAQSLKSVLYLLVFAMILPIFSVLLGTSEFMFEIASVASIISLVFEFVVFFMLRTANSTFKVAFKLCTAATVLNILKIAVEPFFTGYDVAFAAFSCVPSLLFVAKNICLFVGLKKLIEPYGNTKIIKDTAIFYIQCNLYPIISLFYLDDRTSSFFMGLVFITLSFAAYFMFIANMLKISDILYRSDHEYKVDISVKNRFITALAVFAFAVVSILGADIAYSKIGINKSDNVPYSIEDCEMEQAEYERICANISSYGIDENLVSLMPKSEIARYRNAFNESEITESGRELLDYYSKNLNYDDTTFSFNIGKYDPEKIADFTSVHNYSVPLGYSEDGLQLIRFIKVFKVHSSATKMYKDTVMFEDLVDNLDEMFPVYVDEPYNGDLLVAVKLENSCLYKRDLKLIVDEWDDPIEGFMFDVEPGILIFYATTREINDVSATVTNLNYTYYHQKYPVMFPIRNIDEISAVDSYSILSTFNTFKYNASNHYYVMPGREYYVPVKSEEKKNSSKDFDGIVVF